MSYIVWDNDECFTFKTAKEAWAYIQPIQNDNPDLKFYGFGRTVTNINNHVAVLRQFDTINPWENAPNYMRPISPNLPEIKV